MRIETASLSNQMLFPEKSNCQTRGIAHVLPDGREECRENGEASGIRTRDPVIKSHMLYQLSYRPENYGF